MTEPQQYWTTEDLAEASKKTGQPMGIRQIQRLCRSGALPAFRPGREYLIADKDARAWLARRDSPRGGDG